MTRVTLESVLTCPLCGHAKRETMPTDTCSTSTSVSFTKRCCGLNRATAACFAPGALYHAPPLQRANCWDQSTARLRPAAIKRKRALAP